ncbi:MAG: hypothetical protein QOH04_625 [Sphingomonadales bacterium]|jgi:mono/diheme cytochrome c family protein|nr:hypothetical protein [Sphingomonadales bacterium]
MRGHLEAFLLAGAALLPIAGMAAAQTGPVTYLNQGSAWTPATRSDFYTRDQGAQMIPLAWLRALKTPNGQPFLGDGLARYGYLPNPASPAGLPIGFTVAGPTGNQMTGMTCAACHTRQIVANGQEYRVDGGPALSDFQTFLHDMDVAAGQVASDPAAFTAFASAVLGPNAPASKVAELKQDFGLWYARWHALMSGALPADPWGLGRLDAVSMIFNRLTGLDLGSPPTRIIASNILPADAPVRYPFLWNAPIQDKTQWPGFSDNGDDLLALSRNLGEVYGVFGTYRPKKEWWHFFGINFLSGNSANFGGLGKLEGLVKKIGAPKWPWPLNPVLVARGKTIYGWSTAQGGCADCHGQRPGKERFLFKKTWATPIMDVGTDSHEHDILAHTANSGVLAGVQIPFGPKIQPTDKAFMLLGVSVIGSILQHYTTPLLARASARHARSGRTPSPPKLRPGQSELRGAFVAPPAASGPVQYPYESRVLYGIWAAAPYLHNGSVATLADLLKPAAQRPASFAVGRYYDTRAVGLAADQHGSRYTRVTTGCEARNSGNSRCGHEYGMTLPAADKQALLEYLKSM